MLDSKLLTLETEKRFKIVWFMTFIRHALIMKEEAIGTIVLNEQSFEPTPPRGLSSHPQISASFNPHLRRLYLSKMVISTITNGQGGENEKPEYSSSNGPHLLYHTNSHKPQRLVQKRGGKNVRAKCNRWLQRSF